MSVLRFDRRTKPVEMFRHRRARKVAPGVYSVIGRDGKTRYEVSIDGDSVTCTCEAGQHERPCYHAATALRRLRNEYRVSPNIVRLAGVA